MDNWHKIILLALSVVSLQAQTIVLNSFRYVAAGGGGGGTISFGAAGTVGTGSTSLTPAYPAGLASGNMILMPVASKYPANSPATPSGWTLVGQGSGGAGAAGSDSGTMYITVYSKISDGTESGTVTVTITSGNSAVGRMFSYAKTAGTWNVAMVSGADSTAGTDWSATGASDPSVVTGDWMVCASAANGANGSAIASLQALTQTGITYGAFVERSDSGTGTGDNCHLVVTDHAATGTSGAAPVHTWTSTMASSAGATAFVRLRLDP